MIGSWAIGSLAIAAAPFVSSVVVDPEELDPIVFPVRVRVDAILSPPTTGVVSGCRLVPHVPADDGVTVNSGIVRIELAIVSVASQDVYFTDPDPTDDRYDTVYVDAFGVVGVSIGTPSAGPQVIPVLPANTCSLGSVLIHGGGGVSVDWVLEGFTSFRYANAAASTVTSSVFDSTGATSGGLKFLVVAYKDTGTPPVVSDVAGNFWAPSAEYSPSAAIMVRIYQVDDPGTNNSDAVTVAGAGLCASCHFTWWSGVGVFDDETGDDDTTPGAFEPTTAPAIILLGMAHAGAVASVNSVNEGMTLIGGQITGDGADILGVAVAYLAQESATASINPTVTMSGSPTAAATVLQSFTLD